MIDFTDLTPFRAQEGEEQRFNCPLCSDKKGRLYLNTQNKKWYCFNCGKGGKVGDSAHVSRKRYIERGEARPLMHSDIKATGRKYLEEHNVTETFAWAMGVRSGKDALEGRLLFPAKFHVGSGVRTLFRSAHAVISCSRPKSLAFGKKTFAVYGPLTPPSKEMSKHLQESYRTAVLVEGPADALRVAQYYNSRHWALTDAVCLFGKTLKEDDVFHLSRIFKNFYIMLDAPTHLASPGDETQSTTKLFNALSVFAHGWVVRHNWSHYMACDPAELSNDDMQKITTHIGALLCPSLVPSTGKKSLSVA
jgi:hypothetical protein